MRDQTFIFHNARDFDHQPDGTAVERWETRRSRAAQLCGVDLMLDAFGGVGYNTTSPNELRRAVNDAMDAGKPVLVNAAIDEGAGT